MQKRLFVGNLSYDASVSAVRSLFEARGEVAVIDGATFDGRPLHVVADEESATRVRLAAAMRRVLGYVRYARDHEGAAAASLFLFDEATGDLSGVLAEWDWTRTSFPSHVSDWPTVAASLSKREIRVITAQQASGVERGWFEARGIGGSVCVPLCDDKHRIGVLFFDFDATTRPVERSDLAFLADVGERCSRALARS
nr:hypothetical protein Hi04_10k_c2441B_00013 [uncultured bacterium]